MKTKATARVTVTVEVPITSVWGADCSLSQVYEQAASEAIGLIGNLRTRYSEVHLRIIGEPKVVAVLSEQE